MMYETNNGFDAMHGEATEAHVTEFEIGESKAFGRSAFPQYGKPHARYAKTCNQVDVVEPAIMTCARQLVEIHFSDAINGTFTASPEF
jgi:hypothetical protein